METDMLGINACFLPHGLLKNGRFVLSLSNFLERNGCLLIILRFLR